MEIRDLKCLVKEIAVTESISTTKSKINVIPVLFENGKWRMIEKQAFKVDVNKKRLSPTKDVLITPKLAEQILRKSNFNNRKIDWAKVSRYADMMRKGLWYYNHQGFGFYDNGTLSDGQHRLLAIILSGISFTFKVTSGLILKSSYGIDHGKKRSIGDTAKINGEKGISQRSLKSAAWMTSGSKNKAGTTLSHEELIIFCQEHADALSFSDKVNTLATIRAAVSRLYYNYHMYDEYNNGDSYTRFLELKNVLENGVIKDSKEDYGAIYIYKKTLPGNKKGRTDYNGNNQLNGYYKAEKCIDAFMKRKFLGKVSLSKNDRVERFYLPQERAKILKDIE